MVKIVFKMKTDQAGEQNWNGGFNSCAHFGLVWVYGISTLIGYLMPSPILCI